MIRFEKIEIFLIKTKNFLKILAFKENSLGICPKFLSDTNYSMAVSKKRVIKSLENLNDELKDLIKRQYPGGYEQSISRILNAKNEPIFVFPLETDDATYLIKVPATKNSEGEYDVESNPEEEFSNAAGGGEEDDYGNGGDEFGNSGGDDYDEEGGGKPSREASYDPDFDA